MYDSSGADAHECDNCGAQLPAPDEHGTRTCTFCHSVYTAPAPAATAPPQVNLIINAPGSTGYADYPGMTSTEFSPVNPPKAKRGCGCIGPLFVLVLVVAAIGVPLYFGLKDSGFSFDSVFKPSYSFGGQMAVLPGEPSAPQSFVALSTAYENGSTNGKIVRFNGKDRSAVWTSQGLTGVDTTSAMVVDAKNAYVTGKTKLYALKLTDGTIAWQAALSDDLTASSCGNCLQSIGTHVIAKTSDGNIQAFDQATGAPAWSRTLGQTSAKLVRTKNNLIVTDYVDSDYVTSTLDLATGKDAAVIDPTCARPGGSEPDHAGSSGEFRASPSGDSLLVLFGSSPACVQSFDPAAGTLQWGVTTPEDTSSFSSDVNVIDTTAGLVIGSGNNLAIIDPAHTSYRVVANDKDSTYVPIGLVGTKIVAEVKNSRGTTKTSISGIDLNSADTWQVTFGKETSVDDPDSFSLFSSNASRDGTFTAHVDNGQVYVVTMTEGNSYDHTLSVDQIDGTSGTPKTRVTMDAQSHDLIPSFGPPVWVGTKVITRVGDDTIQTIDAATATVVYKVP